MAINYKAIMDDLVVDLGLDRLSPEKQEALLLKMGEALTKRIFIDTMEKLGESGMAEYEKLMDNNPSQEDVEAFLTNKIPDYDAFVEKIVEDFKVEMKG